MSSISNILFVWPYTSRTFGDYIDNDIIGIDDLVCDLYNYGMI